MSVNSAESSRKGFMDRYLSWFIRWMPDSFVICLALTVLVAILALIFTDTPVWSSDPETVSLLSAWSGSIWNLLAFTMQMVILLATGSAVASSPPAKFVLSKVAALPRNRVQMIILASLVAAALGFVHWGLGMMGGIVLGKEILAQAKLKGIRIHAPLLIAALFSALVPGAAGMSGAAVLYAATPGYMRDLVPESYTEQTPESIPLTETVVRLDFGLLLLICVAIAIVTTIAMHPKNPQKIVEINPEVIDASAGDKKIIIKRDTPAERANASRIIMYLVGGIGLVLSIVYIYRTGIAGLDLNAYNLLFLTLGMVLNAHWGPEYYVGLVRDGIQGTWGFIIQYPFYAGIFGLISATGLGVVLVGAFTAISNHVTWPVIAFLYSGILNIAVPSGGSKFVIEAPYIIPTSIDLGTDIGLVMQAYQMGDAVFNLLIPFFALPYLANFKLKFSQVVGYTVPAVLLMIVTVCVYCLVMAGIS